MFALIVSGTNVEWTNMYDPQDSNLTRGECKIIMEAAMIPDSFILDANGKIYCVSSIPANNGAEMLVDYTDRM